jgi:hypothetical protein
MTHINVVYVLIYSVYTLYQYYLGFFSHKKIKKEIPNNIDQKMKVEKSMYEGWLKQRNICNRIKWETGVTPIKPTRNKKKWMFKERDCGYTN